MTVPSTAVGFPREAMPIISDILDVSTVSVSGGRLVSCIVPERMLADKFLCAVVLQYMRDECCNKFVLLSVA